MFFLPQRPYCTLGPLRDQITYPSSREGVLDEGEEEGTGDAKSSHSGRSSEPDGVEDDELLTLLKNVGATVRDRVGTLQILCCLMVRALACCPTNT